MATSTITINLETLLALGAERDAARAAASTKTTFLEILRAMTEEERAEARALLGVSVAEEGGRKKAGRPKKAAVVTPRLDMGEALKVLDGDIRLVRGDKVYAYDMLTETVGKFVGYLNADGSTVGSDTDADETPVCRPKKAAVGRPKKAALAPVPLPEVAVGEVPSAADYRLSADSIRDDVCVGRKITEANKDRRWSIAVYRETQCGGAIKEGGDLCETCAGRAEAYAAAPKPGGWSGRVTEEPLPWIHMLGTAWASVNADTGRLKWIGDGAESVTSNVSGAEKAAAKAAKAAAREAEKAAKAAEKAAVKAAVKAAKAAAREAEKAAKPKKTKKVATVATSE
jgi:hypothetical protein